MENVKLIIWDLDETFWKGTLSDGEIEPIKSNIEFVKTMTDRGIINSICSKNDFEKTKAKLEELGVYEYFVFPSIDWTPKGNRIKNIITQMQLRPINCLFLDDNINNLQEAKFITPELQTATPDKIKDFLNDSAFKGKDDSSHSRLAQYKILEQKAEEKSHFASNDEFLFQSEIQVELIEDCSDKLERIFEMIHRNNQLNFTKDRISQEEVNKIFTDKNIRSGVVHVKDKYGDHGIIGCYAVKDNKAIQFVFSCRILGMGVEQWVYAELGFPEINVVGEVACQLSNDRPKWINQKVSKESNIKEDDIENQENPKLILYGSCPLRPVWAYLEPKLKNAKFAEIDPPPPIFNLSVLFRENDEFLSKLCQSVNSFDSVNTFDKDICNGNCDYILISLISCENVWKYKSTKTGKYFFSSIMLDEKNSSKTILEEYKGSRVTFDDIKFELSFLRESLPQNITLLIQNIPEVLFSDQNQNFLEIYKSLNKIADDLVSKYDNIKIIDLKKYAKTSADFFEERINHYNRQIGFKLAQDVLSIMAINDKKSNSNQNIPSNAISIHDASIGNTNEKLSYTVFLVNGYLNVQLKLTNAEKFDIKIEVWHDRFKENEINLNNGKMSYQISIAKFGNWFVKILLEYENQKFVFQSSNIVFLINTIYNFIDPAYENYDEFMSSTINHITKTWKEKKDNYLLYSKQLSNLHAAGVNLSDYFVENNINDVTILTNSEFGELFLPCLHNKINIKKIICCDNSYNIRVCGGGYTYKVYSLEELKNTKNFGLTEDDTIFYVCEAAESHLFWFNILNKTPAKRLHIDDVLNYLYTKAFFVNRFSSGLPKIMCVRCPNLMPYSGFPFKLIKSNEKSAKSFLKNETNAYQLLDKEFDKFPPQYKNISKEELKETLQKPSFWDDESYIHKMRDVTGTYLNIKNGFRVTTNQPEKYKGTIYIVGGSHAFGCGVKDSDTIASILQKIVGNNYRVENRANIFDWYGYFYSQIINLIPSLNAKENDIVVFLLNNYREYHNRGVNWKALSDPIIKVDAFPLFEKQDRPDYFLLPEAYNAEGNDAIAKLIKENLDDIGFFK